MSLFLPDTATRRVEFTADCPAGHIGAEWESVRELQSSAGVLSSDRTSLITCPTCDSGAEIVSADLGIPTPRVGDDRLPVLITAPARGTPWPSGGGR